MPQPQSIADLDLSPIQGKTYFTAPREWREEFIYFVMVDRFHDDQDRGATPGPDRRLGVETPDDFYGGALRGITRNLDYIAGLGCTAIWLTPIFENNAGAYHGYNINNYLGVDPHFGTKQDLIDLVEAAHARNPPMRIILDVVVNHSGDNWFYAGSESQPYAGDLRYDFGGWRRPDRPLPVELRDPDLYHRMGSISDPGGWDTYPEVQHGDIDTLKDYANDDDQYGSRTINALIKAHCYWIREADVDGFRVDAVKHMGELACSRFCSGVREYAYSLGKRGFFLYGEAASPQDDLYDRYLGPNTSSSDNETVYFGIDSLLDFRLAEGQGVGRESLRSVLLGQAWPASLFDRWEGQHHRALNRGELGRYLVTFVDNHDSFWQPEGRIAHGASDEQVIAAIGYLLCALGTACIYYGTEQGFEGHGGDNAMREAMFDRTQDGVNLLNADCRIYQEVGRIAAVTRSEPALRFGRMYFRQISGDGVTFGLPYGYEYTLAFSRLLYGEEVLVAYNVASSPRSDAVVVDADLHADENATMRFLYGGGDPVAVQTAGDGTRFVRLELAPHQFAILR
jgi:alpha-amylase